MWLQRSRRTSRSDLNDVQHLARNPLIVVSTVSDPVDNVDAGLVDSPNRRDSSTGGGVLASPGTTVSHGVLVSLEVLASFGVLASSGALVSHGVLAYPGVLASPALDVQRKTNSGSASTVTSDVRLDVSPRATSSRCGDDDEDDDDDRAGRMSTVFTFDINVDEQSDYDV